MLHALALSFGQLGDRRVLGVLLRSLGATLLVFAALGVGLYHALDYAFATYGGSGLIGFAAVLLTLLSAWLAFRAVAIALVGLFADTVVDAVEARYYPEARASARPVGVVRSARMGLASVGRLIGYNAIALPVYVALLVTGVGVPIAFFALNGWLLGRDLGDMVAARHLPPAAMREWRAATRAPRLALGLAVTGMFVVPFLNLVAPVVGAAAMTHLFHRGRRA